MSTQQWNQFMMDYGPIVWFVFLFFITVGLLVKSWPLIRGIVHTIEIIQTLPERLDSLQQQISAVEKEVTTNGGSSIKDAIKRIEDKVYGK